MLIPNKFNGFFAGRRTYFDGGGGGGGGDGAGFGGAEGSNSAANAAAEAAATAAAADANAAVAAGGSGSDGGIGGSGVLGGTSAQYNPYKLNEYIPQQTDRQFYQPIYRPQYTNYGGGISGLSQQPQQEMQPQQPNMQDYFSGVSAMPFRGQQFASYGLPFSGYDWPTYSNGGGISSLVR
jgi:hypothetical protein